MMTKALRSLPAAVVDSSRSLITNWHRTLGRQLIWLDGQPDPAIGGFPGERKN